MDYITAYGFMLICFIFGVIVGFATYCIIDKKEKI